MTGYAIDDLRGQIYVDTVQARDASGNVIPKEQRLITRSMTHDSRVLQEKYTLVRKDGTTLEVSALVSPVSVEGEFVGAVQVYRDITREQVIDRAKTEFVSLASHQLRTPLSTINWYTEMLLSGDAGPVSDKQKSYLTEVYGGSKRMVDLVNSLLNVSRIEMGSFGVEPQEVQVKEVMNSVLQDLAADLQTKKLHVETAYDDVESVTADPKLLRLIFQNLMTNAQRYSRPEGTIRFSAARRENDILFTVRDTGIGIPTASQEKIFTKLYRADNAQTAQPDGDGLGLYMVKSILDNTGGRIWFESEERKGSAFYVTIPLKGMTQKNGTKGLIS